MKKTVTDYYVQQMEDARVGRIGSDRMSLGLSAIPDRERGDMDKVLALLQEVEAKDREYKGKARLFGMAQADWLLAESEYKDEINALRKEVEALQSVLRWIRDNPDGSPMMPRDLRAAQVRALEAKS